MFGLSKEKLSMDAVIRDKESMRCVKDRALTLLCCKRSGEDPVNESPDILSHIKLTRTCHSTPHGDQSLALGKVEPIQLITFGLIVKAL